MWSAGQAILNGLLYGALLSVIRMVNFAPGAFMMLGMYVAYLLFDSLGISPYLGFVAAAAVLFVLGFLAYQGLLRRIADRSEFMQILLTLGISQMIIGGAQIKFGTNFLQINLPVRGSYQRIGGLITLNNGDLLAAGIAVALAVGMFWFVMKTRFGRALRAIAQNRYAAPLIGINVQRTQAIAFGLGIAAVGLAGGLLLPALFLYPEVGAQYTDRKSTRLNSS